MSKQEDFKKAAADYVDGEPDGAQKIVGQVGFEFGAKHGYQYAVEKACEWLRENMEYYLGDYNLAEDELEDNQVYYDAMLEELRKAMEE